MNDYWTTRHPQKAGRATGGAPIGILLIESKWALIPGNVANASTHNFPVLYETISDISFEELLGVSQSVESKIIDGAKKLEAQGVKGILGACGSFALYQKKVAGSVNIPVFLSPMLQIPWILSGLNERKKIVVIVAVKKAITDRVYEQCNIQEQHRELLKIIEAIEVAEFIKMSTDADGFTPCVLERELVDWLQGMDLSEFGAILLQCSDLPPYAAAIQSATSLPVFDANGMASWLFHAVQRQTYEGSL